MKSIKTQKLNFTEKKKQKLIGYFYSQSSKYHPQNKSIKKYLPNKDKKFIEDQKSIVHSTISQNKISNRYIFSNDINCKTLKKITPQSILKRIKDMKKKEGSEKKSSKKMYNVISISSIIKNNLNSDFYHNLSNNLLNSLENNSNINIGSNNKITIIKNIFNRTNKTKIKEKEKEKNKRVQDIKMRIVKIKNNNKSNFTILSNPKDLRNKKIDKALRNKIRKKIINRQSLSTYNSIENMGNENGFATSNINNKYIKEKDIFQCYTTSQNLKYSINVNNFRDRLNISSLDHSKKKKNLSNVSYSNLINTYPSLNNSKSERKCKIKNIKTLSINADINYKNKLKFSNTFKSKKNQRKINFVKSKNKKGSSHSHMKHKISSTSTNNNNIIKKTNLGNPIAYNNEGKIKSNFYQKIQKFRLKNTRSNSINVNINNNIRQKKFNSDINNNISSLMNMRQNNKLYLLKLKEKEREKDLTEDRTFQKNIFPPNRNKKNKEKDRYKINKENPYFYMTGSSSSLYIQDDTYKNSLNLKEKMKIVDDYYKTKEYSNEKSKNKSSNNTFFKKNNTNIKRYDANKDSFNTNIEEDKIYNNICQNSLKMYSIYILSRYFSYFDKVGLSRILLYDKNNNIIPVLYSNCNCDIDTSVLFENNNNKYRNKKNKHLIKLNSLKQQNPVLDIPFICEFKPNLYINFFVNNIQSDNIDHLEILNYFNNKQKISPSKDIKIYQQKILLYEGVLNMDKSTKIFFSSKNHDKLNASSTLSASNRRRINLFNSNIKLDRKKIDFKYKSPKSKVCAKKKTKNYNEEIFDGNDIIKDSDSVRKCLFDSIKTQDENEMILSQNININNSIQSQEVHDKNYVKFENIRIVLISNYGHKDYVGLTGLEFIDNKGKIINIEKAKTIGALPKDLHTIYNDEKEKRIFENVFNGDNNTNDANCMWVTKLNNTNIPFFTNPYIELSFYDKICLSKIKIYNYNDSHNLDICAREIKIFFDNKYYGKVFLRQGIGENIFSSMKTKGSMDENEDFSQEITFPLTNFELDEKYITKKLKKNKFSSILFKQNYETPFLPSGFVIKFQFNNNFCNESNYFDTSNNIFLKYKVIGVNKIEIYNEKGINILNENIEYKIISNCEILSDDSIGENSNKILLNGTQNENGNNCLFYIFNQPIFLAYIKLYPLEIVDNFKSENSVKDFKIFCDNYIIYEGTMNKDKPSIVYFTSDIKIYNEINNDCLIKCFKYRKVIEEKNENYFSMTLL